MWATGPRARSNSNTGHMAAGVMVMSYAGGSHAGRCYGDVLCRRVTCRRVFIGMFMPAGVKVMSFAGGHMPVGVIVMSYAGGSHFQLTSDLNGFELLCKLINRG